MLWTTVDATEAQLSCQKERDHLREGLQWEWDMWLAFFTESSDLAYKLDEDEVEVTVCCLLQLGN